MAWSVRLQDERGKPIVDRDAGIEFETLAGVSATGMLRYIDPYGDTIFNRVQMKDFIAEWTSLRPQDPMQSQECAEVLRMAKRCENEPHIYLRFIGD